MKKLFLRITGLALAVATAFSAFITASSAGSADAEKAATGIAGDVDRDGTVSNMDVTALFRYVTSRKGNVDEIACDCDGDGDITNKDVVLLFHHVSNPSTIIYYGVPHTDEPNNIFRTFTPNLASCFTTLNQTTAEFSEEGVRLVYNKTSVIKDPFVVFDIARYIKMTGRDPLKGIEGSYIVLKMKSTGDGYMEVFTQAQSENDTSGSGYASDGEWHYVVIDMTGTTFIDPDELSTVRFDWTGSNTAPGAETTISEIAFFTSITEVCAHTGLAVDELYGQTVETLTLPEGDVSAYITSAATLEPVTVDGENAVKVTSADKTVRLNLNVYDLAALQGGVTRKAHYLAVRIKQSGFESLSVTLYSVTDITGTQVSSSQKGIIDVSEDGWRGVLFDIRSFKFKDDTIRKISLDFKGFTEDSELIFGGISVTPDLNTALTTAGNTEYLLNMDYDLEDSDELKNATLEAENEDGKLNVWFDHMTEKTLQRETIGSGRSGYTVKMAKNESENCQFFISPYKDMNVRVQVDPFTDGENSVTCEVYYEYYHNISNVMTPDALPPYDGSVISVAAHTSQGFVLQFTTLPGTPAGTYFSVVHVYDADTGEEIKRSPVAVKVWDFVISDETELRTAFALWTGYIFDHYNWNAVDFDYYDVVDNYFNFFRKYRINIMDYPNGITSSRGNAYMSDPRTNTARWLNLDVSVTEDNNGVTPDWINKVIYYPGEIDEPRTNQQFTLIRQISERIKANTPDYRMVAPFERNLDLTADGVITTFEKADTDQIGYMGNYLNIWCPTLNAFTKRNQSFISQVSFIQSEEQDAKYGTFIDRMKQNVAEGDELWTYICINPKQPYANWQILSDGTEAVVSAWQMKEYGITGMLYWAVNYWKVNYMDQAHPWTGSDSFGDGILIYSGYFFGPLPSPVASTRLENIRDGIEDYQMLCMLEEALGEEAAAEMVRRITSSVVTYADDDDYIHNVRVLLGDTLEQLLGN